MAARHGGSEGVAMSVTYVKGDLLSFAQWNCAAHCVNDEGVIGSGVAKALRDRWPAVYDVYRKAYDDGELRLGTFTVADVEAGRKVVNLCAQHSYRKDPADKSRFVDYEALYSGLETLRDALENGVREGRGPYSLGVPYLMASDRAGGAWVVVETMLQYLFAGSQIPLYIVELPPKTLHA